MTKPTDTRTVAPGRDYPGMISMTFPDGRVVACLGAGKAVEAAIVALWEKSRG